jgi:hypothetical protein
MPIQEMRNPPSPLKTPQVSQNCIIINIMELTHTARANISLMLPHEQKNILSPPPPVKNRLTFKTWPQLTI